MKYKYVNESEIHKKYYKEILEKVTNDRFAQFLGFKLLEFSPGMAVVEMKVKDHMLNAHDTVHGGIIYTLADYAFAIACNSYGKLSVGLSTTTHFMKSASVGDIIEAKAEEERRNYRTGFYRITVTHNEELIATVEAIAYRKDQYFIEID